jgi:hypothetical protein
MQVSKFLAAPLLAVALTGCAMATSPVTGFAFTQVKGPASVGDNNPSSKVGRAMCTSYLGIVATGDASIDAAAKAAGITKIHHVDFESFSVLGFYATFTTVVYGD